MLWSIFSMIAIPPLSVWFLLEGMNERSKIKITHDEGILVCARHLDIMCSASLALLSLKLNSFTELSSNLYGFISMCL